MTRLSIRLDFGASGRVGPGKIRLLELIDQLGSITQAGRNMGMSYRRAWLLIDDLNRLFCEPAVVTQMGGSGGGGASLTAFGQELVRRYRAIEADAERVAVPELDALERSLAPLPPQEPV